MDPLPWDQGGEDIPEYSLGRLLVSDADESRLTVFDLDSASVAGTLRVTAASPVMAGSNGRYSYVQDGAARILYVLDPGEWLLSHIDHFHVVKSDLGFRGEQLEVGALASFTSHEGWIALTDAERGSVTIFQERSLTAMAFAPVTIDMEPHRAVAVVSHAHVLMSELSEDGVWGIGVRDVAEPAALRRHVPGCSAPSGIAAEGELVYVACAEGLLTLRWIDAASAELEIDFSPEEAAGFAPRMVRTNPGLGAVLFDRGTALILRGPGGVLKQLAFEREILDLQIRRQGSAALVLTADGALHEVQLPALEEDRALQVVAPYTGGAGRRPRFVLSHAYAYVADARASDVPAVRLQEMEIESMLPVGGAPLEIAIAGMPLTYTDMRE